MSSTCSSAEDKGRHLKLAGVVKGVHAKLRRQYKESGDFEQTWQEHCHNETLLSEYADAMHHLATDHWSKKPETRIDWCRHVCHQYFFEDDGLMKVLEKDERTKQYEHGQRGNNLSVSDSEKGSSQLSGTPHLSTDDLEQLAKDIDSCTTCSPTKTKPSANLFDKLKGSIQDTPPSIVVESAAVTKQACETSENVENVRDQDNDSERPRLSLTPFYEENSLSRDISQATSLETAQVSLLPQPGSGQNSEISDSWENLEESDLHADSVEDNKVNFSIGEDDIQGEGGDAGNLEADREALYSKYKPVQYNTITLPFQGKIRLLDVGSCFNPFVQFEEFQSIGIDISPAVESVYKCDFLSLETHEPLQVAPDTEKSFLNTLHSPIETLPKDLFHVVVFSLLLEYFPSPYQRWICCQKAHNLLMMNGLLLIITPDSHSQHKNAPMMKSWKKAIESMGFKRWKYVKQEHLHCMAFRKITYEQSLLVSDVSPDMLYIPQDFNTTEESSGYDYFFEASPRTDDENSFIRQCYDELPDVLGD